MEPAVRRTVPPGNSGDTQKVMNESLTSMLDGATSVLVESGLAEPLQQAADPPATVPHDHHSHHQHREQPEQPETPEFLKVEVAGHQSHSERQ